MNTTAEPLVPARYWLWIGWGVGVIAAYLFWFAPDQIGGLDTGHLGSAAMLMTLWSLIYGLQRTRPRADGPGMGEKEAWVALAATVVIGLYFFTKIPGLGWELDIQSRAARQVGMNIVAMMVGASILIRMLRSREGDTTLEDERDGVIRQRAASRSHSVLVVTLVVLIVTLSLNSPDRITFATTDVIALMLIGIILISEIVRHASEIWYYRRERL